MPSEIDAYKSLKKAEYLKKHCKPALIRKASAGILLIDYKLANKKTPCVFIPIKKKQEAMSIFKQIKSSKEHLLKKTGLAIISVKKGADGKEEITFELKKGGLNAETLIAKGTALLESTIKMKMHIVGTETAETGIKQSP